MSHQETFRQKLDRYRRALRGDVLRDRSETIRQRREAAELKAKQRRVQASESCREGAT